MIKPTPSRLLLVFLLLAHLSAAAVLLTVPGLESWWRLSLLISTVLSIIYSGCLHTNRWPKKSVKTLYWREFGGWELTDGNNQHLPVILQSSSFSRLWLNVLNFKTRKALGGRCYTVILLSDNCPLAVRRQLRMRMKLLQAK